MLKNLTMEHEIYFTAADYVWPEFREMNNVHNKWLLRAAILLFNSDYNDPEYLKIYRLLHGKGTHTAFLHELVIQTNKYQNAVQVPSR